MVIRVLLLAFSVALLGGLVFLMGYPTTDVSAQDGKYIPYTESGPFYSANNFIGKGIFKTGPLKVVSYNLNFSPDPEGVAEELAKLPSLQEADVILLQEVTGPVGGAGNAAERIAKSLKMNYVYSPGMFFSKFDYGNAILSRFQLMNFKKYNLPVSSAESYIQRSALQADVLVGFRKTQIISIHMSVKFRDVVGSDRGRALQMESVLTRIPTKSRSRTIIGGDFNTFSPRGNKKLYAVLEKHGYRDMTLSKAWTMRYLHIRLDHIYARGPFQHEADGVEYEAKVSDHVPIWSRFELVNPKR